MRPVTVTMDDGSQVTGWHVATDEEHFMHVMTETEMVRLDSWRVAKYGVAR